MANRHRGETEAVIGGAPRRLCLTLGALAELEHKLGAGDLVGLAARFEAGRLGARDVLAVIACGLRGGGEAVTDAEVAAMAFPGGLPGAIAGEDAGEQGGLPVGQPRQRLRQRPGERRLGARAGERGLGELRQGAQRGDVLVGEHHVVLGGLGEPQGVPQPPAALAGVGDA